MANQPDIKSPSFRATGSVALSTAANGLSEVLDTSGKTLSAIAMPASWTDAIISFLAGRSSDTLQNVFTSTGGEVTVTTTANRFVALDPTQFVGARFVQLRSGDSSTAVAQAAARTLNLLLIG